MSEMADTIEAAVATILGDVNVMVPGRIVSYNAATNRAVVKPTLPKRLADGTELDAPPIHEVPILWPVSGGAVFTMPLQAGDEVWIEFSQRSLDGWLAGNDAAPDDPRRFDLTDAVARVGSGRDVQNVDTGAAVLRMGATSLRVEPGMVRIIGNLEVEGSIHSTQDIVAQVISLLTHRHQETGSITQVPRP